MALEMELKYLNADFDDMRERMKEAGGRSSGPYYESNLVFDDAKRSLKKQGTLLRLREKQGKSVLTVKKKPENPNSSRLKVFEEIESGVDDFDALKDALEAIGFTVAFGYEKVREKWAFMDCTVCLDHLPFGDFVEIEGTEETVSACAVALAIDGNSTTKKTYYALNLESQERNSQTVDESFLFSGEERERLFRELMKE